MSPRTWNWTLAAIAAIFLGAAWHLEPDPDLSGELNAAQRQARAEFRQEQSAAQFCVKALGYGAAHSWDAQGRLRCHSHRSAKPIITTQPKS